MCLKRFQPTACSSSSALGCSQVFEDVSSCPGNTPKAVFHGQTADVALMSGGSQVARVPTPLKVTHGADCSSATMDLQLNTTVDSLTGRVFMLNGVNVYYAAVPRTSTHARAPAITLRRLNSTQVCPAHRDDFISSRVPIWLPLR